MEDHTGDDDDGSDVQGMIYDNESVHEQEGEVDREVIEAFREASQISLMTEAQVCGRLLSLVLVLVVTLSIRQ